MITAVDVKSTVIAFAPFLNLNFRCNASTKKVNSSGMVAGNR